MSVRRVRKSAKDRARLGLTGRRPRRFCAEDIVFAKRSERWVPLTPNKEPHPCIPGEQQ